MLPVNAWMPIGTFSVEAFASVLSPHKIDRQHASGYQYEAVTRIAILPYVAAVVPILPSCPRSQINAF